MPATRRAFLEYTPAGEGLHEPLLNEGARVSPRDRGHSTQQGQKVLEEGRGSVGLEALRTV